MNQIVKRGYVPTDSKEFNETNYKLLIKAQNELFYFVLTLLYFFA
jgi:hypothetical protein